MENRPIFGQLVVGPPGSGKTTYCKAIAEHLKTMGREVILLNLDPGNEVLPYKASININDLITLDDAMSKMKLGPNGAFLYCMEYLETNYDWLSDEIVEHCLNKSVTNPYLLIDCPGQVELFINHQSIKNVIQRLSRTAGPNLDLRLCVVNLVDSHYSNNASKYISALLNSLTTMLHFELPHINVLSKADLMDQYGKSKLGLDFYCEVQSLDYLIEQITDDPFMEKHKKLTKAIAGVVEDYSLVSFIPLDVGNAKTLLRVVHAVDKANGFHLTDIETEEQMTRLFRTMGEADFDYAKYSDLMDKM